MPNLQNELQWFHLKIVHQDSSPQKGHQGDITDKALFLFYPSWDTIIHLRPLW